MTYTNYTKLILNIKDENIYFDENCLEIVNIKGIETKVFHGYLTYTPEYCPKCGCVNESFDDIIKWNWKRNCKIKIPKTCGFNTLLVLDKQRFYCKNCHKTFTATTDVVEFHKQISNDTNLNIKLELMQKGSEKDIAKRNNVSSNHVNRILDEIAEDKLVKNYGTLPEVMGIDEFNATKDTTSKLAFIIIDQNKHNIFDINNSRLSLDIEKYFRRYSKQERDKVKFITMDLYKPYYTLMNKLFKNATLVADRFHIILQVSNALDNTRIKLCSKSNPNYKKLKKYWKLILKSEDELDDKTKKYNKHFKKEMTQKEIVTYLINTNDTLYNDYQIYQGIIKSIDKRDKESYLNIVNNNIHNKKLSVKMKKALKTFNIMKKYVLNALEYEYFNGIVEGINNVIKQVKHAACGYKRFNHLKARVMLIKGLYNPIKQN